MVQDGRYQPSVDQRALASTISGALADILPINRLHGSTCETDEAWHELEALGLFGIALGEADGGSGLGATEEVLIASSLGRQLVAPSVLATLGAAPVRVQGQKPFSEGGKRVTVAYESRGRTIQLDDPGAEMLLLRTLSPALHGPASDIRSLVDDRWTVDFSEIEAPGPVLAALNSREALRLRLLDAAALAGLAEAAMEMAVGYAGLREQFGRPIGTFQAIKHRCADMAVAARGAMDLVTFAAIAFDDHRDDVTMLVESAVVMAGTAAIDNARANIQIHGGIGFSDEADPHLLLKRAQVYLAVAGGLEAATERVAAACGQA